MHYHHHHQKRIEFCDCLHFTKYFLGEQNNFGSRYMNGVTSAFAQREIATCYDDTDWWNFKTFYIELTGVN